MSKEQVTPVGQVEQAAEAVLKELSPLEYPEQLTPFLTSGVIFYLDKAITSLN